MPGGGGRRGGLPGRSVAGAWDSRGTLRAPSRLGAWGGSGGLGAETPSPELAGTGSVSVCSPGSEGAGRGAPQSSVVTYGEDAWKEGNSWVAGGKFVCSESGAPAWDDNF